MFGLACTVHPSVPIQLLSPPDPVHPPSLTSCCLTAPKTRCSAPLQDAMEADMFLGISRLTEVYLAVQWRTGPQFRPIRWSRSKSPCCTWLNKFPINVVAVLCFSFDLCFGHLNHGARELPSILKKFPIMQPAGQDVSSPLFLA